MTTTEAQNKAFVLEAFDTLFNKRDYAAAERFWSPRLQGERTWQLAHYDFKGRQSHERWRLGAGESRPGHSSQHE